MANSTLRNLETSAFVATPLVRGHQIAHLMQFTDEPTTVFDPTAGEGDLLLPFAAVPGVRLYGVEISRDRALEARRRLPQATILINAVEATTVTARSMGLVVTNPPYLFLDGSRAEYQVITQAGATLRAGGILVAVLPARSAWSRTMVNHWCKNYERVRVWKFPDGPEDDPASFQRYTQIVVAGMRRAKPLEEPDPVEQERLLGWRWMELKAGVFGWAGGTPPPDLPAAPLEDPYVVPTVRTLPQLVARQASEELLLEALEQSGVQTSPDWNWATTWKPDAVAEAPLMPLLGETHQAAEILTGLLDGEPLTGPAGERCLFTSFVSQKWTEVEVDAEQLEEEREKGVSNLRVYRQADFPVLGALNLGTGEWRYYQGEEVYAFLAPWLRGLANRVFEKRRPLYELNPEAWELEVCGAIGVDKQLPGAPHAGLVAAQLHRVFAMGRALDQRGRVAEQADPGTGKTRQATALAARQAAQWRQAQALWGLAAAAQAGRTDPQPCAAKAQALRSRSAFPLPAWTRRLRQAWQRNPRSQALLPPGQQGPRALPVLVMTPKRVLSVWRSELAHAWPEAEVLVLDHYTAVDRWMQRCVESSAPAVIGIVSHGLSRAHGRCWKPAVIEHRKKRVVNDLEPPDTLLEQLEEVHDQKGKFVGFRWKDTGLFYTKTILESRFDCPACGELVQAVPEGKKGKKQEADTLEAVTRIEWFEKQPRSCASCRSPLWCEVRVIPDAKKALPLEEVIFQGYRNVPYATWERGVAANRSAGRVGIPSRIAQPRLSPAFGWHTGGKLPKAPAGSEREAGEEQTGGQNPRSGLRMSKACRNPQAPIDRNACRIVNAAGRKARMGPESFYPAEYLHTFYRGCVAFTLVDESHNGKGQNTDVAHSFHLAQRASQGIVYASGTQYGGKLTDFYHYWFRLHPQFWRRLGLGWKDAELAMRVYGVVEKQVREHENEARRGSGQTDVTVKNVPAPGISAKLLPHLMADLVFLGVLDVGAFMPPRIEIPIVVPMKDPALEAALAPARAAHQEAWKALEEARRQLTELRAQQTSGAKGLDADVAAAQVAQDAAEAQLQEAAAEEARVQGWVKARDLAANYDGIVKTLEDAAKAGNSGAAMAKATIPRWWSVLPCMDPKFTVTHTLRGTWGEVLGKETILTTPLLASDYRYPLEERLHQEVMRQQVAGNTTMIYFEQNGEVKKGQRNLAPRLEEVLREFHPWTLLNRVEAEDREEAIRTATRAGHRCLIVPYLRVKEGLNLHDCIDTIIWGEMALNYFALDQASRRNWRMGREQPATHIYLVYAGSEGHAKLCRLAHQSGAAAAFAGEPARGALVEHVRADKTMLSRLGRSLEELETEETPALASQEELEAAFARRSEELAATLKRGRQWAGYEDTLPERLAAFHAARLLPPAPIVEAEVLEAAVPEAPAALRLLPQPALVDVEAEAGITDLEADAVVVASAVPAEAPAASQQHVVPPPLWDVVEPVEPVAPAARIVPPPAPAVRPTAPVTRETPAARPPAQPAAQVAPGRTAPAAPSRPPARAKAAPSCPQGATISVQWWNVVVQFPEKGRHVETMRQLKRAYGGGYDWEMGAWVFPLDACKQPVHVLDAVLEAFPDLEGAAEARERAMDKLLGQLRALYREVHAGRTPNEEALCREVQTPTAAQRWIRVLQRRLDVMAQPEQASA